MTQYPDLFAALAAPFDESEVKTRTQNGRQLQYITARTVENRLDDVLGPENWWEETTPLCDGTGGFLCRLTIRLPDGKELTRTGIGAPGKESPTSFGPKTAESDALKRAASKLLVGRYLHRDGVPRFALERAFVPDAPNSDPAPRSPQAGRQAPRRGDPPPARQQAPPTRARQDGNAQPPLTGKALYGWIMDQEKQHGAGLLKYVSGWARLQEFPGRMVEWDADQVSEAHHEAVRKIAEYQRSDEFQESLTN